MHEHSGGDPESHINLHQIFCVNNIDLQINEKHEIDFDNIKILDRASNNDKFSWKKLLHIRKYNPSLNVNRIKNRFFRG